MIPLLCPNRFLPNDVNMTLLYSKVLYGDVFYFIFLV